MKIILLKDVKNLGKKDDLIEAKDGYARNFLFPRKMAIEANDENLEQWKRDRKEEEEEERANIKKYNEIKKELEKKKIKILAKAGENGRLFGAITSNDIKNALEEQAKIEVDKKKIELEGNIKTEGIKTVSVKLYKDIVANVKIEVEAK
ncbi:MAG: 50S ribosomal protein L9 [Peptoniphilaceae bacterium]